MKTLRIVFMGSPDFAVPSMEKLHKSRHNVTAVVTGTDKKRGRGGKLSPTPVKAVAQHLKIPVIEADKMKDPATIGAVGAENPDLIVVVAFKILPDQILSIPKYGAVNLHASLLPKYRGAAPIHHAVMNGESETGCTVFKLDSGIDTGGIILQDKMPVGENETTGSVYGRMMQSGSDLLVEAVNRLADGTAAFTRQDESKATPAPKLFDEHCLVDFNRDSDTVHNHIRGLSPFPCAYAMLDRKILKLIESRRAKGMNGKAEPGEIRILDNRVYAACNPGWVELCTVRYEGKKEMPALDFINGYKGDARLTSS